MRTPVLGSEIEQAEMSLYPPKEKRIRETPDRQAAPLLSRPRCRFAYFTDKVPNERFA
jgi:hypothetical protein